MTRFTGKQKPNAKSQRSKAEKQETIEPQRTRSTQGKTKNLTQSHKEAKPKSKK
jgi:hypothetical protein